ncbi:MAG: hypothetical protein Tsb0019_19170 [Roseibium sp.]
MFAGWAAATPGNEEAPDKAARSISFLKNCMKFNLIDPVASAARNSGSRRARHLPIAVRLPVRFDRKPAEVPRSRLRGESPELELVKREIGKKLFRLP